jgi:hypothetical protein
MTVRCWALALGGSLLMSSPSAQTPASPSATSLGFDGCREVTLLFRNVSTDAERSTLPAGFIARRNAFGRPIFWFENAFCESIGVNGASGRQELIPSCLPGLFRRKSRLFQPRRTST